MTIEKENKEDDEALDIPPKALFWHRPAEHTRHLELTLECEPDQLPEEKYFQATKANRYSVVWVQSSSRCVRCKVQSTKFLQQHNGLMTHLRNEATNVKKKKHSSGLAAER